MGNHPMPPGDIHDPRSGLETFRHNPFAISVGPMAFDRSQVIRPAPVPAPRFHNLATPN